MGRKKDNVETYFFTIRAKRAFQCYITNVCLVLYEKQPTCIGEIINFFESKMLIKKRVLRFQVWVEFEETNKPCLQHMDIIFK